MDEYVKKLQSANMKIRSVKRLEKFIKRKSFLIYKELLEWRKKLSPGKKIEQREVDEAYVADINMRRVLQKYVSGIEVSIFSVLMNEFSGNGHIVSKANTIFYDKHTKGKNATLKKEYNKAKKQIRWKKRVNIPIETVLQEANLSFLIYLYITTDIDHTKLSPFKKVPTLDFLLMLKDLRNAIAHNDKFFKKYDLSELTTIVTDLSKYIDITKRDKQLLDKYTNMVYNTFTI